MTSKNFDRLGGALFLALAVAVYMLARRFPDNAPDAARYTEFLALTLGALSLVLVFSAKGQVSVVWFKALKPWLITAFLSFVYVLLVTPLGFYPASALYVPVLSWSLGLRRPVMLVLSVVITLVVVWLVFQKFLMVPVPMGTLWGA